VSIDVTVEIDVGDLETSDLLSECAERGFSTFDPGRGGPEQFAREMWEAFDQRDRRRFEMLMERILPPSIHMLSLGLALDIARAEAGFGRAA